MDTLTTPDRPSRVHLYGLSCQFEGETLPPETSDGPLTVKTCRQMGAFSYTLGGCEGQCETEQIQYEDWELVRERFTSPETGLSAIRLHLTRCADSPGELNRLIPFELDTSEPVRLDGADVADWQVLRLGRFKSDVPGVFRPGLDDQDLRDASFNAQRVTAGAGVRGNLDSMFNKEHLVGEPLMYLRRDSADAGPGVCFAALDQKEHLTTLLLQIERDPVRLHRFQAGFEFDGVEVLPGKTVSSHWLVIYEAADAEAALDRLVTLQQRHLKIAPPQERLNLFCSWYFYGREFLPEDLEENLAELRRNPVPFDVFIIDNGWIDAFGDFGPNAKWPMGMPWAAEKIAAEGMVPGIWTAPFVMMKHSRAVQQFPQLIARNAAGEPVEFGYVEGSCYVVDPTAPGAEDYFREIYTRLRGWGFRYHKLDFVRALAVNEDIRFYDRRFNRVKAYRKGLGMIKDILGPDCHVLACGGLYDAANFGVADSIRTGSDSIGSWDIPNGERTAGTLVQIKQGLVRNYLSRLIQTDPDSLMLRRRETPFRLHEVEKHNWLSDGKFTDEEARSLVIRQFLGGGNTNVTERLVELPEDRRRLLPLCIPAFGPPARILDLDAPNCPSVFLSRIKPRAAGVEDWWILAVANWTDQAVTRNVLLREWMPGLEDRWVAFELCEQRPLGIVEPEEAIELIIPPHGTRLIRLAPWRNRPVLAGTDLHASGGGVEIAELQADDEGLQGRVDTPWPLPVTVHAVLPADPVPVWQSHTCPPGDRIFHLP